MTSHLCCIVHSRQALRRRCCRSRPFHRSPSLLIVATCVWTVGFWCSYWYRFLGRRSVSTVASSSSSSSSPGFLVIPNRFCSRCSPCFHPTTRKIQADQYLGHVTRTLICATTRTSALTNSFPTRLPESSRKPQLGRCDTHRHGAVTLTLCNNKPSLFLFQGKIPSTATTTLTRLGIHPPCTFTFRIYLCTPPPE